MTVADYMKTKVITVSPTTKVSVAVNMMKDNQIHRLPVLDGSQLVGIVTVGIVEAASPSDATSLSIYEVNYLFNQMTVGDIMETAVQTIEQDAILEDAIYKMRQKQIGVLPVMAGVEMVGIITTNDVMDAFLDITDYFEKSVIVQVTIEQNRTGVIAAIGQIMADNHYSIQTLMVTRHMGEIMIEIHVDPTERASVVAALMDNGYQTK